jgi:hypothetical protein
MVSLGQPLDLQHRNVTHKKNLATKQGKRHES